MDTHSIEQLSDEFMTFSLFFHQMFKSRFQKDCQIKANSLAFQALMLLQSLHQQPLTMSALAEQMEITKQQLTKLVNALEEKELVERIHDQKNRRQVYVQITAHGYRLMDQLFCDLLSDTAACLSVLSVEEQEELHICLTSLQRLMAKIAEKNG